MVLVLVLVLVRFFSPKKQSDTPEEWKYASGYHQRSKAETAMYRFKQLINSKLGLRNYNAQVGEALAGAGKNHENSLFCKQLETTFFETTFNHPSVVI